MPRAAEMLMMIVVGLSLCLEGASEAVLRGKSLGATNFKSNSKLWTDGKVRYAIGNGLKQDDSRIQKAVQEWETKTCIRLTKCESVGSCAKPFIKFVHGSGCSSPVGKNGGVNTIVLADGCTKGAAIHEIGHSLGLTHEHTRRDRDEHVKIKWDNIQKGKGHNFQRGDSTYSRDLGKYDFRSIMHYSGRAFGINNWRTIIPHNGESIGQRSGLSAGDVAAIQFMYNGCSSSFSQPTCLASEEEESTVSVGEVFTVEFDSRYSTRLVVELQYDAPAATISAFPDAPVEWMSSTNAKLTFSPTATEQGKTFTFTGKFTGKDGKTGMCSVSVKVA